MTEPTTYSIMHLPIVGLVVCDVPVLPGTPTVMRDGEAIPIEERTEICAQDAQWLMGNQAVCDHHLFEAVGVLHGDGQQKEWNEVVGELRWLQTDVREWRLEDRHEQDEARQLAAEWAARHG